MTSQVGTSGQGQRLFIMMAALLAVVMLWGAAWYASSSWQAMQAARQKLTDARQRSLSSAQLRAAYAKYQAWQQQERSLDARIVRSGLIADDWNARSITIVKAELPRRQVQAYLIGMANKRGYFFAPAAFELRTLQAGGNIFQWQKGNGNNLSLTLKGEYFMRRQQP